MFPLIHELTEGKDMGKNTRWKCWFIISAFVVLCQQKGLATEQITAQSGVYLTASDAVWTEFFDATFSATEAIVLSTTYFELTEHSLVQLPNAQVPRNIVEKLSPVVGHVLHLEEDFWALIAQHIGEAKTGQYQQAIEQAAKHEKLFVVYGQDKPVWKTVLSVFEQRHERILWSYDEYLFYMGAGTHNPTLTGGYWNSNAEVELLLTYFTGTGWGSAGQSGTTVMVLLFDEQVLTNGTFEIGEYTLERCDPMDENCRPREYQKETQFLFFPTCESDDWRAYLWTAIDDRGPDPVTGQQRHKYVYQLTEIFSQNHRVVDMNTSEDTRTHLLGRLRAIVKEHREDGLTAIFLSPYLTLFDEETWFNFYNRRGGE